MREAEPRTDFLYGTEVLDHVVDINDKPLREGIMNEVLENDIKLIMPFGSPRGGKTTLATQLAHAIAEDSHGLKKAELVFFDDALRDAQALYDLGPISEWVGEWVQASDFYYERIEDKIDSAPENTIIIAENVAVGDTDRGVSTLNELVRAHPLDAFFIGVVRDPNVGNKALQVREMLLSYKDGVHQIPDLAVLDFLKSQDILVTGGVKLNAEEAGRRIRKIVSRMDPFYDLPSIAKTEEEENGMFDKLEDYRRNGFPRGSNRLPELSEIIILVGEQTKLGLSGRIGGLLPNSIVQSGLSSVELSTIEIQAAYIKNLRLEKGINQNRFRLAFNSFLRNTAINYLDLDLHED